MAPSPHDLIHETFGRNEQELIELHRAIVRFPTVNHGDGTPANEDQFAAFGREYLKKAGVESRILESAPHRANLLAETGDGGPTMLWMSHSDVVPPGDEAAWTHGPFSGALEDGRIYGRGANDCKMLVAASLFAMAQLKALGLPRGGTLRVAVGADEEVGGELGFGWLAREHPEFLRADVAICEGAGSCLGCFEDGIPVCSVGTGEKGRYEVTYRVRGEGGHACTPWGKFNPISVLHELMNRIEAWRPYPAPASPVFAHVGRWVGFEGGIDENNLEEAIGRLENQSDSLIRSLRGQSRMTFTPTMVGAGDKSNALPTEARLVCDIRTLPGQPREEVERMAHDFADDLRGVEIEIQTTTDPSVSDFPDSIAEMFERATRLAVGAPVKTVPVWSVGATDARFVRSVGTPVYGYQLVHPDADPNRLGIHCIDESIEASMLLPCALSLAHSAVEFCS